MKSKILATTVLLLCAFPAFAAHTDCQAICSDVCQAAIEEMHNVQGGCTNYGWLGSNWVMADNLCHTQVGKWKIATQSCDSSGCSVVGTLRCIKPNGMPSAPPFELHCGPGAGWAGQGMPKVVSYPGSASCTYSDGHSIHIYCSEDGESVVVLQY